MTILRRQALVSGRVQGVGFRWSARNRALALGISGWARNLPDGRVEVEFEGAPDAVSAFSEWLSQGPGSARVNRVQLSDAAPTGETGFAV